MDEVKQSLSRLYQNLNILQEREAKYGVMRRWNC
jgi:hypothetical protein